MALVEGQALPGGWAALTVTDALLVLARPAGSPWAALRRLGFVVIPVVLAAALLAGTWEVDAGLKLVAWPVVALLAVVAVLGVLAALRAAARVGLSHRLEVDSARRVVSGLPLAPESFWALRPRPQSARWDEVQQVVVSVHPGGSTGAGLVGLAVALKGGGRLLGPEQACHDAELDEYSRALTRVAEALAQRLGVAVDLQKPPG